MPGEQLRDELVHQTDRKVAAMEALSAHGPEARFTAGGIVGDDDISMELPAAPELTGHAVEILNTLSMPHEAPLPRARVAQIEELRMVLRSPAEPDVERDVARFELGAPHLDRGTAQCPRHRARRLRS